MDSTAHETKRMIETSSGGAGSKSRECARFPIMYVFFNMTLGGWRERARPRRCGFNVGLVSQMQTDTRNLDM